LIWALSKLMAEQIGSLRNWANGKSATPNKSALRLTKTADNDSYAAFFALAHLAFAAARMFAKPAALIFFLAFLTGLAASALPCAAILLATPARIFAIAWALNFLLGFCAGSADGAVPWILAHLAC
jgi:hypothetical protein